MLSASRRSDILRVTCSVLASSFHLGTFAISIYQSVSIYTYPTNYYCKVKGAVLEEYSMPGKRWENLATTSIEITQEDIIADEYADGIDQIMRGLLGRMVNRAEKGGGTWEFEVSIKARRKE